MDVIFTRCVPRGVLRVWRVSGRTRIWRVRSRGAPHLGGVGPIELDETASTCGPLRAAGPA